jgi:hypothetical protein
VVFVLRGRDECQIEREIWTAQPRIDTSVVEKEFPAWEAQLPAKKAEWEAHREAQRQQKEASQRKRLQELQQWRTEKLKDVQVLADELRAEEQQAEEDAAQERARLEQYERDAAEQRAAVLNERRQEWETAPHDPSSKIWTRKRDRRRRGDS